MSLQKDSFLIQLLVLRPTEEHLKSFALYLKTFEDSFTTIKEGIEYVHESSGIHHRITIYYLLNEVFNMKISAQLRAALRSFAKENFQRDVALSMRFEFLNKRILQLERLWKQNKIMDFERKYSLEDVVMKIKEDFYDKEKLVKTLRDILKEFTDGDTCQDG